MNPRSPGKYVIYECDACRRVTQLVLDGRRPDPTRCNITLRCRGMLVRLGERRNREFLLTPPAPGLTDYTQRGALPTPGVVPVGTVNRIIGPR